MKYSWKLIVFAIFAGAQIASAQISQNELAGLKSIFSEEELAFNVYNEMSEVWDLPIFQNTKNAEQRHMEMVQAFLNKNNISFTNMEEESSNRVYELTELQNELIVQGKKTIIDALKSGAYIEELDIRDIMTEMEKVQNGELTDLYGSLLQGSKNHLKAYTSQLSNRGITYQPILLTKDTYDGILAAPKQCCQSGSKGCSKKSAKANCNSKEKDKCKKGKGKKCCNA